MNDMLAWNLLAIIVLAIPCYIVLKASWEAIYSGLDPLIFIGLFFGIGVGYSVLIGNLMYFREERKD